MTGGVHGRLVTASFARDVLPGLPGVEAPPAWFGRALEAWFQRTEPALGPASGVRAIADVAVVPLLELLGLEVDGRHDAATRCRLLVRRGTRIAATVQVVPWNEPLARSWRPAVHQAIAADARWCFCCNGRAVRIVDARRTWSRDYLEFDAAVLAQQTGAQALFWALASGAALAADPPLLDRAVDLSARHGLAVCRAMGQGVLEALRLFVGALSAAGRGSHAPEVLFEHSVTVLYRILFLLFAEARGLVPMWHPIYRDRYSLDAIVTALLAGHPCRGLWQAVHAISRLAHAGCVAGELRVTAFNGRLFSPSQAAAFDLARLDDHVMSRAVVAVSTTPAKLTAGRGRSSPPTAPAERPGRPPAGEPGRTRVLFRDLDVEQLGSVYEQLLEYVPSTQDARSVLAHTRDLRKATGTFYTPKAVSSFLVRRTLEPLVRGRGADEILRLRVLDPAMGSGAFLVAACRYLASAREEALIQEGRWHPGDVTPADRVALRREIAAQCLFGVDLNPMAVQLARLSLWLATLASDKPLSFLDHHLVVGDSLIGAAPEDVARQPSRVRGRAARQAPLPLFGDGELATSLEHAVRIRLTLAARPDDSAAVVRDKERALAALQDRDSAIGRWSRVLDLWCSGWFLADAPPPDPATFHALCDLVLRGRSVLPGRLADPLLACADETAARARFLHWPLMFPEVFTNERGEPWARPGFDAVLGNPPWDMVRGDSGDAHQRSGRQRTARHLTSFVRESGVYQVASRAHVNRYQLFVERALHLVRAGGRIGLVLPSGVASDTGAAALRRHLFDKAAVESITGLDNRAGIFPIHRSVRFVLLTATAGRPTSDVACRFGVTRPEDLEGVHTPLQLTRRFLCRLSGDDDLGIPEIASPLDLRIVERVSAEVPRLGVEEGWNVRFGRELNASDDRGAFSPRTGRPSSRPVVEGKHIEPFRVRLERCRLEIAADAAPRVRVLRRARLAYRDIASATNRLTLIAAVIPAHAVTTHTLFCLKTPLPAAEQHVLAALLNSFVANYLVRLRVNTHVTAGLVARLPIPAVRAGHASFDHLAALARGLAASRTPVEDSAEYAELQAVVARLYGLNAAELEHVLSTFPLVARDTKARVLSRFAAISWP